MAPRDDGDCYEIHCWMLCNPFTEELHDATLVHGRPTLRCAPFIEYGHAWLELNGECIDMTLGKVSIVPKEVYYKAGSIDPEKCLRYTRAEAKRKASQFGHWGPWDGPEGCPPLEIEDDESPRETEEDPPPEEQELADHR